MYNKVKTVSISIIDKVPFLKNLSKLIVGFFCRTLTRISPELNTRFLYFFKFGKKINLKSPNTFNEKLLKLKLDSYEKNSLIIQCSDKYSVRDYVVEKGCSEILNDLIASYNKIDDIKWDKLPSQFAMKWNFGCGYNIICKDKSRLNFEKVKKQLRKWDKSKYYLNYSEMQYKNVKHIIIVEKYLKNSENDQIDDYKVYCFNGIPKIVLVCKERTNSGAKYFYYDTDWNLLKLERNCEYVEKENVDKPDNLDQLLNYASVLSEPFKFVRADFYIINGKIYFGELTFTPCGCLDTAYKSESDLYLGSLLAI